METSVHRLLIPPWQNSSQWYLLYLEVREVRFATEILRGWISFIKHLVGMLCKQKGVCV